MRITKCFSLITVLFATSTLSFAGTKGTETFEDTYATWKNHPEEHFSDAEANFKKVKEMLLKQYFDSKITDEVLYRAATQGMLAALNTNDHPWNGLLSPTELQEMEGDLKGEVTGIGVQMKFDASTGITNIYGIIPGSAAEKAGVKAGDQIISVNGRLYKGLQLRDIVYDIRGKVGDQVKLKLLRGDNVLTKSIVRAKVAWLPVEWSMISKNIGVLAIRSFSETTSELIRNALAALKKENLKGLVIDLRGNAGGLFKQAIESASLFVPKDSIVVNVVARDRAVEAIKATGTPLIERVPIVIITNHNTASGAELFAASLIEDLGAKLVGERTLGKWNAQELEKLSNNFAVKFTVKQFQSPKGHSFLNTGLQPDVEVSSNDDEASSQNLSLKTSSEKLGADMKLRAAVNLIKG